MCRDKYVKAMVGESPNDRNDRGSGICSEHCIFIPSLEKPRLCWNMVCFNHLYGSACICWDFESVTQSYWSLPITLPGDKLSCQGMSLKLGILNTRHGLTFKPSLDEKTLELQVKTSIGAEAISQQRLAAAEAEIADLRQKLEASKREKSGLSDILKSKNEENEAYISEIEVNEVGSVTKSIEAMKISKRVGSSIADFPTGLDTAPILELPW